MKLSKNKLNQIIQEEYNRMLQEQGASYEGDRRRAGGPRGARLRYLAIPEGPPAPGTASPGIPPMERDVMTHYNPYAGHGQSMRGDISQEDAWALEDEGIVDSNEWMGDYAGDRRYQSDGTGELNYPVHPLQEKLARQIERYIYENLKG